jgi:hypothetical protein
MKTEKGKGERRQGIVVGGPFGGLTLIGVSCWVVSGGK